MKIVKKNKLERVLVSEQWWSTNSALLSNQNHKNLFKFIFFKILLYEEIIFKFALTANVCAHTKIFIT